MKSAAIQETTAIGPESLIGTKWIAWSEFIGDRMAVEFVDKTNCIYTSRPKEFPMTYNVMDDKVYLSNVEGSFELRGQVLFKGGLPAFKKTA